MPAQTRGISSLCAAPGDPARIRHPRRARRSNGGGIDSRSPWHAGAHEVGGYVTLPKRMKFVAGTAGALVAVVLALGAWHTFAPRLTPAGQPPLCRLDVGGAARVGAFFDAETD